MESHYKVFIKIGRFFLGEECDVDWNHRYFFIGKFYSGYYREKIKFPF